MKYILTITIALLFFISCKKEISSFKADEYLQKVQQSLKDSISANDYATLDFSKSVLSKVDSVNLYVLRIPFKDKKFENDFVVLKTTVEGTVQLGKIIHQEGVITETDVNGIKKRAFNGNIVMLSLNREVIFASPIVDGYISGLHITSMQRTAVVEAPGMMPEVVITYVIHSSGISWSTWFSLQAYFSEFGSYSWGNYFGPYNPDMGGGGGSPYGSPYGYPYGSGPGGNPPSGGGGGPVIEEPMLIDLETMDENEAIDIEKFINCFNSIPDAGATCSIEVLSDIPVDKDPNKIFDLGSRSPGHTFLNIIKRNGSQSASQNIGFYPKNGLKIIATNAPIDGKFVDNGLHEFNCGFKISITPAQLTSAITQMQRSKNWKYDIDNYNCTDWALDVFNAAGGNLQIPLYDIPGNYPSTGTRMPNGVYNKLLEMKNANDPRAGGITIGILKGWAGNSTGPCN